MPEFHTSPAARVRRHINDADEVPMRDKDLDPLDPIDVLAAKILKELQEFLDPTFRRRYQDGLTSPKEIARAIAYAVQAGRLP